MNKISEALKRTFLFQNNSSLELQKVVEICKKIHVPKGEVLIENGEVPTKLYIVVFGSVLFSLEKNDGMEEPVTIIGNDQILSAEGLFDEGEKSIFTARTLENCDLLEINYAELNNLFSTEPELAAKCNKSVQKFYTNLIKKLANKLTENKMSKFF